MLGVGGSFAVVVADVLWGSLAEFGSGSLGLAAFLVLNGYVNEGGSCVQIYVGLGWSCGDEGASIGAVG
jgi:hypothetical protein